MVLGCAKGREIGSDEVLILPILLPSTADASPEGGSGAAEVPAADLPPTGDEDAGSPPSVTQPPAPEAEAPDAALAAASGSDSGP